MLESFFDNVADYKATGSVFCRATGNNYFCIAMFTLVTTWFEDYNFGKKLHTKLLERLTGNFNKRLFKAYFSIS